MQELQAIFGEPRSITEAFLKTDESGATEKLYHVRKRTGRILIFVVAALVLGTLILGTIYVIDNHGFTHGYWVESPATEGEYIPDPDALYSY